MKIFVSDTAVVGEVDAVLFSMLQQGQVSALVTLRNAGTNTVNYRWQEFNGTAWVDVGNTSTLIAGQTVPCVVTSSYPQVRLSGNASGGALLDFSVTRTADRPAGGPLPILSM